MSVILGETSGEAAYGLKVFYIDGEEDVENLPIKDVKLGSCAFSMSTGDLYFLRVDPEDDTKLKWIMLEVS